MEARGLCASRSFQRLGSGGTTGDLQPQSGAAEGAPEGSRLDPALPRGCKGLSRIGRGLAVQGR